ncbi:galactoside 2-alpha-L-fucosyltransferase-like [Magnolia sinica]|uniref:galactoside 2-alpha-L-fucosyltransferase-like n=1 Tax=Magnolia sinica TaxID=86752 RepID=UPI00265AB749|nr:galactoside 2-alpha-L-fucosyltransferase-like [Magnolia sinica]
MDMKRIKRQLSSSTRTDPENDGFHRSADRKSGSNMVRLTSILVVCLMVLLILVTFGVIHRDPATDRARGVSEDLGFKANVQKDRIHRVEGGRDSEETAEKGLEDDGLSQSADMLKDKLLGGLLAPGFDEGSCLSRYQSVLYRKASTQRPSSNLLARLRKYEALHRQCGPNTDSYNKTVDQLKSGHNPGTTDCKYVVWISHSGLGNRILTLASTFLYALLTDRVLLVDRGADMGDLFCEPFPKISWLLPLDFPLNQFKNFTEKSPQSYGIMLKNNIINDNKENISAGSLPAFAYLHLAHDYDDYDKLFFCEQDQLLLQRIPWLILRSDNYFVPSLFLIPTFEQELSRLFPRKDTVFHHLGRYLFHPSNSVWGLITRFYQAYLAHAEERIGIQIRVFDTGTGPFQHVLDQILACSLSEKLLPKVALQEPSSSTAKRRLKAVLMTSLSSGYFEKIRNMYWENPTISGEIVSVVQPSHEEYQQTEKQMHNMKAWAEMYLLSLTDALVTSSWSTFGYVAQGLGGLKPWILYKPENSTAPDPPCRRAMSMEPCFHAPPFYDCKAKKGIDTGLLVPHVRHCEDMSWGLKVVGEDEL